MRNSKKQKYCVICEKYILPESIPSETTVSSPGASVATESAAESRQTSPSEMTTSEKDQSKALSSTSSNYSKEISVVRERLANLSELLVSTPVTAVDSTKNICEAMASVAKVLAEMSKLTWKWKHSGWIYLINLSMKATNWSQLYANLKHIQLFDERPMMV